MITLSPTDSSILGRVLQYQSIPIEERMLWLSKASKPAQKVAKYVLGLLEEEPSEDIRKAAAAVRGWLDTNRRIGEVRRAKRSLHTMRK